MKLLIIHIQNYRSIEDVEVNMIPLEDGSFSYGLMGVNEAGKSSLLKAIALKEVKDDGTGLIPLTSKDFKDKSSPIEVVYYYKSEGADQKEFGSYLLGLDPPIDPSGLNFEDIKIILTVDISNPSVRNFRIDFSQLDNDRKEEIQAHLKSVVLSKLHKAIFWTSEDKYLISQPINLSDFADSPETVSIPLKNCFLLAEVKDIRASINSAINDSTEMEYLENILGEKVTEHIRTVWSNHPIQITFQINSGMINFHIRDSKTKEKAKTADQRSDGFKQFISFLLTISAQDRNNELTNSILLLDEPETHLHPQAQEFLLGELIKISSNNRGNFVLFATHSVFMIDRYDLSRNYRVIKRDNDKTELVKFDKGLSSYSSVTYEVFEIPTSDYHNELYGRLHQKYEDEDSSDKTRSYVRTFDTAVLAKSLKQERPWRKTPNQVTLPTYIRNCIHHPDNGDKYTDKELRRSIEELRKLLGI